MSQGERLLELADPGTAGPAAVRRVGAKAARLAVALQAGLPVLPGFLIPVNESCAALGAGARAVRREGMQAGRRAVLRHRVDPPLAAELRAAVRTLGGRVMVRSSSPLESDSRWSGAFSSVAEVGPDDVATAVRSCWASAFAVDPLARLAACGLPPEALELALLLQPELRPDAGGVARADGGEVTVEGVKGHPAALLSGWAEGVQARVRLVSGKPGQARAQGPELPGPAQQAPGGRQARGRASRMPPGQALVADAGLAGLIGGDLVAEVARLAGLAHRTLGDDLIEWAAAGGKVWLLQSARTAPPPLEVADRGRSKEPDPGTQPPLAGKLAAGPGAAAPEAADPGRARKWRRSAPPRGGSTEPQADRAAVPREAAPSGAAPGLPAGVRARLASREWMPLLAELAQTQGQRVPARPAAPGVAAGRLVACRPHERPGAGTRDAILLIDRPVPALAPLLFGARGVIARAGAAGSHLAEVARSLSVPMVIGCHPDPVLVQGLPGQEWIAAVDGAAGDVALLLESVISDA